MERVKVLINTLQQQAQQNAGPAVLLATLQQIQLELTGGVASAGRQLGTAKVAVVMPNNHSRFMPPVQETADFVKEDTTQKIPQEAEAVVTEAKVEYEHAATAVKKDTGWTFDPLREIPTLSHQLNSKELNDIIGHSGASLNDKLKTEKTELAEILNEAPIKDLKKGIGINDRFVFLSELFRGDDAMYERSIKTINAFRILAEAEYWIERELKVKLGWDDGKATTQHFYQLVKRRFS